jgi:hypothetical protein
MARFALLLAVAVLSWAGAALASTGPKLSIRGLAPLTVAGERFAARERVTVTVRVAGRRVARRAVTAGARGVFRVRFSPFLAVDPCRGSIVVTAAGTAGSRASVRRPCRPPDPQ